MREKVKKFIYENFPKCVRYTPEDGETIIGTPRPYIVSCTQNFFQELYYWDTYFTNKGLFLSGDTKLAQDNVENIIFLINKLGYMPNGSRTYYLNRSQPPFFGLMIKDIYEATGDTDFLQRAYLALKKEMYFWKTRRFEGGLHHYGCDDPDDVCINGSDQYYERTGVHLPRTLHYGRSVYAEYESGWDLCPRYKGECLDYWSIDLNCLIYASLTLIKSFENILGINDEESYQQDSESIKKYADKYLRKDNIYYDCNIKTLEVNNVISCASFYPYFTGLASDDKGFDILIKELERDYGLIACRSQGGRYQWAEPNGWAPLHYVAVAAAIKLGKQDIAMRVSDKYISATELLFRQTGYLWEKYNVINGSIEVASEYGTPDMLGWTAGVYLALTNYMEKGILI